MQNQILDQELNEKLTNQETLKNKEVPSMEVNQNDDIIMSEEEMIKYHENEMNLSVYMEETHKSLEAAFKMGKNIILHGPGGHNKSCYSINYLGSKGINPFVQTMGSGMTTDRLFGGIDLKEFNETGKIKYLVENSFMNQEFVIFEELFDAPDYILEQLKDILSSGYFRDANNTFRIKTKLIICCTNRTRVEFSKNASLAALMERFPYECEVKWKQYNANSYSKLLTTKMGFADPLLVYILEQFANDKTDKKIISPRIALLAAETIAELGPDYLDVIADFQQKPQLLKDAKQKFKDINAINTLIKDIQTEHVASKALYTECNNNLTPENIEAINLTITKLTDLIDKLSKIKKPEEKATECVTLEKTIKTHIEAVKAYLQVSEIVSEMESDSEDLTFDVE